MPSGPVATVVPIIRTARELDPSRVLDLGMGTGKYGFLIREQLDWAQGRRSIHLTGVEGFPDNVREHHRAIYDEIVIADIRDYLAGVNGTRFDLALLCDVIEHFDPQDAVAVCNRILSVADVLLVTTPSRFFEQHDTPLEEHRSWWPAWKLRELAQRLGARVATADLEHTTYGALSRTVQPSLIYERPAKTALRAIRDRLRRPRSDAPTI